MRIPILLELFTLRDGPKNPYIFLGKRRMEYDGRIYFLIKRKPFKPLMFYCSIIRFSVKNGGSIMCELLGMNFTEPVSCGFSFQGFAKRGKSSPDGWGIAMYPEGSKAIQLIKEPISFGRSKLAGFVKQYSNQFKSKVFLSHVRYATSEICYSNTHPFVREVNGREYAFAHNGALSQYEAELSLGRWKPVGSTDSEYAFCYLLQIFEDISQNWNENSFKKLESIMKRINEFGSFNCLLSDGEHLFCYRDKTGYKGFCYTERKSTFNNSVRLVDEDIEVYLQEAEGKNEAGFIVATAPLTNEHWQELTPGALMVFKDGKQIYPIKKQNLEEKQLHALHLIQRREHRVGMLELISSIGLRLEKADEVLQTLVDMEYIKQDSQDQGGSVAPSSTYYTVVHKRNEIDRLINEDTEKVLLPATSINFLGAGKDDKVLACVRCWVFYKAGATFCRKCLHKTVEMDTSIADIIVTLNQKGFKTEYCCCGDNSNGIPYVYFGINVVGLSAPTNFAWGRGESENLLTMIPYHKARGIPRRKMVHLSEKVVEVYRIKNIEALRAWANELPRNKIES